MGVHPVTGFHTLVAHSILVFAISYWFFIYYFKKSPKRTNCSFRVGGFTVLPSGI
jgi:hypothetical protein